MYIIVALIVIIVIVIIAISQGNVSFWKLASRHPDEFYNLIKDNDVWLIDDGTPFKKSDYDGLFHLFVPSLNKTIKYYALADKIKESQKLITKELEKLVR